MKINIKHFSSHFNPLKHFEKKKIKHTMSHHLFYFLFFETFEGIETTQKALYIDFHVVLERNQTYRKMFYMNFSMHMKISFTGKTVLSFIPSGICSHAKMFVGTKESTSTFRIQDKREIIGFSADKTNKRFVNHTRVF